MDTRDSVNYKDNACKGFGKSLVESLGIIGEMEFVLRDTITGKIKKKLLVKNTVCNGGLDTIADGVADRADTLPTHMAVGTTSGGKTGASTTLEAEVGSSRTALTSTTQGSGANGNKVTWLCTFAAGVGTGALKEAGVFNASSGGTMFCYAEFGTLTKEAADELTVTWTLTCGTRV